MIICSLLSFCCLELLQRHAHFITSTSSQSLQAVKLQMNFTNQQSGLLVATCFCNARKINLHRSSCKKSCACHGPASAGGSCRLTTNRVMHGIVDEHVLEVFQSSWQLVSACWHLLVEQSAGEGTALGDGGKRAHVHQCLRSALPPSFSLYYSMYIIYIYIYMCIPLYSQLLLSVALHCCAVISTASGLRAAPSPSMQSTSCDLDRATPG